MITTEELAKLRIAGWSNQQIGDKVGMTADAVKKRLRRLRKRGRPPVPPLAASNGRGTSVPPASPPLSLATVKTEGLKWEDESNKVLALVLGLIDNAIQQGRDKDAQAWVDRFWHGIQAKYGLLRVSIDNRQQTVNITIENPEVRKLVKTEVDALLEEIEKEKEGYRCPNCGARYG